MLAAAVLLSVSGAVIVMKWGLASAIAIQAEDLEEAEFAVALAPNDPQTHFAAGILAERSFEPEKIDQAIRHFENAVALSPRNYLLWLELGRARERAGDTAGAEIALRKALLLAPNFTVTHWALGNLLVRQGQFDTGFTELRIAADASPEHRFSGVLTAWGVFGGDIEAVRRSMGSTADVNALVALLLARSGRMDEALSILDQTAPEELSETSRSAALQVAGMMAEQKRYRDSLRLSQTFGHTNDQIRKEQITNGGFEDPVDPDGEGIFKWSFGAGGEPRIALTDGERRNGSLSLLLMFSGQPPNTGFRNIMQTVAVEPGGRYRFIVYYKSQFRTDAGLQWSIANAANGAKISGTGKLAAVSAEWRSVEAVFAVPADTDGIIISLMPAECTGLRCALTGNIWFDDIALERF